MTKAEVITTQDPMADMAVPQWPATTIVPLFPDSI